MKNITVTLNTISSIFPSVATLTIDDEVVGFICENQQENRDKKPQSIVLNNGETLGDFCCTEHAVKAAAKHHCGEDGIYVSEKDMFADMGPLGVLLAAMLLAKKEKEKGPHEAGHSQI